MKWVINFRLITRVDSTLRGTKKDTLTYLNEIMCFVSDTLSFCGIDLGFLMFTEDTHNLIFIIV